ncbi:MAG: 50S ribosomal protein L11 methyltransferase [Bacteroidia bacterium]
MDELQKEHFEGFMESGSGFTVYVTRSNFNREVFEKILLNHNINPDMVPENSDESENWNAQWEANFEPILIGNRLLVKAPYHVLEGDYRYELFLHSGTVFEMGEAESAELNFTLMLQMNFTGKTVLDFGSKDAVVGIFASMLGAEKVVVAAAEGQSMEHLHENSSLNSVTNVELAHGGFNNLNEGVFDYIFVNTPKDIYLQNLTKLFKMLVPGGQLIVGGVKDKDFVDVKFTTEKYNLVMEDIETKKWWCVVYFNKPA